MGRGDRSNLAAISDLRRSGVPKATDFIEIFGEMAEWSEIDCKIEGATISLTECPEASDEVKEAMDTLGLDYDNETIWEASIEFPRDPMANGVTISTHQPSRDLALATILAVEDCFIRRGHFSQNPEVKVLSYPYKDTVPAMLWADVTLPEIGQVSLLASGEDLLDALGRLKDFLPQAELPN